ncbi:MAG: glycosyltransferase [Ferruginibacter sp.]
MQDMPLVSVAIITYNQKIFLREAIESVLAQDYENIEIVIGDDFSTDGTQEMLLGYKQSYGSKFILRFAEKNQGNTANSNQVHFACSGKYIAWLGGDDIMLPGKIRKQVDFMEKNPGYNIVYHNLDVFDSETKRHLYYFNNTRTAYTGHVEVLIKHGTFNGACATMVRRSASPVYGFDSKLLIASDWLYWIEHLVKGGKIGYLNEVLGQYRRHGNNVTSFSSPLAIQGVNDWIDTCFILLQRFPHYKKHIFNRLSLILRGARRIEYLPNLTKSLKYNLFNIPSWVFLVTHYLSLKKIKL